MLMKLLPLAFALTMTSSLFAHTLDFDAAMRRATVDGVKWNGAAYGFRYLFDINDAIAVGPYLTSSAWSVSNSAVDGHSKGNNREVGPEVRFQAPLKGLNFIAGAAYTLLSTGTAQGPEGQTADLRLEGLRFNVGFALPVSSGFDVNVKLIKGLQTVTIEGREGKAQSEMDEFGLALGVAF